MVICQSFSAVPRHCTTTRYFISEQVHVPDTRAYQIALKNGNEQFTCQNMDCCQEAVNQINNSGFKSTINAKTLKWTGILTLGNRRSFITLIYAAINIKRLSQRCSSTSHMQRWMRHHSSLIILNILLWWCFGVSSLTRLYHLWSLKLKSQLLIKTTRSLIHHAISQLTATWLSFVGCIILDLSKTGSKNHIMSMTTSTQARLHTEVTSSMNTWPILSQVPIAGLKFPMMHIMC